MAVDVQRPQKKENEGLNKLMMGLSAAGTVSSISANQAKIDQAKEQEADATESTAMSRRYKKSQYGSYA